MRRNFWIDISLVILLVVNVVTVAGGEAGTNFSAPLRSHLHAISGTGLMLIGLFHIILHIPWFRAVVNGKVKGRIKLFMYGMVSTFIMLGFISGIITNASVGIERFHETIGSLALVGLAIHSIKHVRWMILSGKKIFAARPEETSVAYSMKG